MGSSSLVSQRSLDLLHGRQHALVMARGKFCSKLLQT
jgi:hypothetical protein